MDANPPPLFEFLFGTAAAVVQTAAKAVLIKAWRSFIESKRANHNHVPQQGSQCPNAGN
jgi:hypothetical protein